MPGGPPPQVGPGVRKIDAAPVGEGGHGDVDDRFHVRLVILLCWQEGLAGIGQHDGLTLALRGIGACLILRRGQAGPFDVRAGPVRHQLDQLETAVVKPGRRGASYHAHADQLVLDEDGTAGGTGQGKVEPTGQELQTIAVIERLRGPGAGDQLEQSTSGMEAEGPEILGAEAV